MADRMLSSICTYPGIICHYRDRALLAVSCDNCIYTASEHCSKQQHFHLQDASRALLEEEPAPQNLDVQEAIHASLDLSQQAQPSSAQHEAARDSGAVADANFHEAVSKALETGMAEPADSKSSQQVLRPSSAQSNHAVDVRTEYPALLCNNL